jgi:hypothetical protein
VLVLQVAASHQAKQRMKAQKHASSEISAQASPIMMKVVPCHLKHPNQESIVNWGGAANMSTVAFEHSATCNIRYIAEGSREVLVCSYNDLYMWYSALEVGAGQQPKGFAPDFTVVTLVHEFFSKRMVDEGWRIMETAGGVLYKGTAPAHSLMYVPTAVVIADRAIGGTPIQGWRTSVVEDVRAGERMKLLREHMSAYTNAASNVVMANFDVVETLINRLAAKSGTVAGATAPAPATASPAAADSAGASATPAETSQDR